MARKRNDEHPSVTAQIASRLELVIEECRRPIPWRKLDFFGPLQVFYRTRNRPECRGAAGTLHPSLKRVIRHNLDDADGLANLNSGLALSLLVFVTIIAISVTVWMQWRELKPLRAESKRLNEDRGTLVIEDRSKFNAIKMPDRFANEGAGLADKDPLLC